MHGELIKWLQSVYNERDYAQIFELLSHTAVHVEYFNITIKKIHHASVLHQALFTYYYTCTCT